MLTVVVIYLALVSVCLGAIFSPFIGVLGYYAFVLLQPEWNWKWHFQEPIGFQKYITAATLIGTVISLNRRIPLSPLVSRSIIAGLGFVLLMFISYSNSIRPLETWLYVDSLWKIFLMCLLAIIHIDTPKKCLLFMWVLVLCQGFNAYRINEDYFLNGVSSYRRSGYGLFGDNNLYSGMTLATWGGAIALVFHSRTVTQRIVAGMIMILQAHQIMLLESRGAMLGAVLVGPAVIWLMPKTRLNIATLLVGLMGISVLAGPSVVEEFVSILGSGEEGKLDGSAESRFDLWRAGWLITMNHPLFGVGPWAAQFLVPAMLGGSGQSKSLHNIFFEISAGCGIPAAMLYFGFFGLSILGALTVVRKLKAERKHLHEFSQDDETLFSVGAANLLGLIAYFISSLFSAGALLEGSYAVASLGLCGYSCFMARPVRYGEGFEEDDNFILVDHFNDLEPWDTSKNEVGVG